MQDKKHIVQSKEWGDFKTKFGTPAVVVGDIQYTLHKIPHTNLKYAYCPKVNPQGIDWESLEKSLKQNNCFAINFDTPYVIKDAEEEKVCVKLIESKQPKLIKSPKNTFTKNNIILDLKPTEEELLTNMHQKHRYNIRYAEKHGVKIRYAQTKKDYEIFFKLLQETAQRQHFLIHPHKYYKTIWELFAPRQMCEILIAELDGEPLASWMLFVYDNVLYYPYGASTEKHKNLFASNLLGWEAIKYGKKRGCEVFDMWGACKDLNNESDPEWGFTNFKLKFGGKYITYMDSYDYVLNPTIYKLFTFAYPKVIKILKKFS